MISREQDEEADRQQIFQELLRKHQVGLTGLVYRLVRPDEVDDVLQEVSLVLWGSLTKLPTDLAARGSWIHELARRVTFGWINKEIKEQGGKPDPVGRGGTRPVWLPMEGETEAEAAKSLAIGPERPSVESSLITEEKERWQRKMLKEALDDLDPELRAAYVEVRLRGQGSLEATKRLGITRATLLTRIRKASDQVARHLDIACVDCTVFDAGGRRISALVRLQTSRSQIVCEAQANKRDPVRFEGLQTGQYVLTAVAPEYVSFERELRLDPGLTQLPIILQRDSSSRLPM